MKKEILLLIITVSISSSGFPQQHKNQGSDSTSILQLENDWAKALINRDETVFNKLLADDFFYTENEKMYTR